MASEETLQHYKGVLNDLLERQKRCREELAEIDPMIDNVRRYIARNQVQQMPLVSLPTVSVPRAGTFGKYSGMSVRWAILNLLAEDVSGPLTTSQIANSLLQNGIRTSGQRFAGNVSAILSQMSNREPSPEVSNSETGYVITEHGMTVWNGIKTTEQYQNRLAVASGQ